MFHNQILDTQNKLNINSIHSTVNGLKCLNSDMDLQYELYSKYMHLSKQQFAIQELMLIKDSQSLLETMEASRKKQQPKDASSTMDSLCYDEEFDHSIVQEFSCIERRTPRKLTRKGTRHSALKPLGRAAEQFNDILSEIEQNCAEKTYSVVKSLLDQYKKNMSQIIEIQKKQKNLRKIQQKTEKAQQESLIYKRKLNEIQEKLKSKDQQIKGLKQKLNQLKVIQKQNLRSPTKHFTSVSMKCLSQQQSTITSQSHSQQSQFLSIFINTKQARINQRMTKIQQIQTRIQTLIETAVLKPGKQEGACGKCCQMIKKIKQSVMNYRLYLQEESEECERMFNMLKVEVESCLRDRNVQMINV